MCRVDARVNMSLPELGVCWKRFGAGVADCRMGVGVSGVGAAGQILTADLQELLVDYAGHEAVARRVEGIGKVASAKKKDKRSMNGRIEADGEQTRQPVRAGFEASAGDLIAAVCAPKQFETIAMLLEPLRVVLTLNPIGCGCQLPRGRAPWKIEGCFIQFSAAALGVAWADPPTPHLSKPILPRFLYPNQIYTGYQVRVWITANENGKWARASESIGYRSRQDPFTQVRL